MTVRYKRKLLSDLVRDELLLLDKNIKKDLPDTEYKLGVFVEGFKPVYRLIIKEEDKEFELDGDTKKDLEANVKLYKKFRGV